MKATLRRKHGINLDKNRIARLLPVLVLFAACSSAPSPPRADVDDRLVEVSSSSEENDVISADDLFLDVLGDQEWDRFDYLISDRSNATIEERLGVNVHSRVLLPDDDYGWLVFAFEDRVVAVARDTREILSPTQGPYRSDSRLRATGCGNAGCRLLIGG